MQPESSFEQAIARVLSQELGSHGLLQASSSSAEGSIEEQKFESNEEQDEMGSLDSNEEAQPQWLVEEHHELSFHGEEFADGAGAEEEFDYYEHGEGVEEFMQESEQEDPP